MADAMGPKVEVIAVEAALDAIRRADGLVNATAIGMAHAPGSAIDLACLGDQQWAFDAVYTPTDTAFLTAAAAKGLTTISGFELFRHMAIGSFAAYTGTHPNLNTALAQLMPLKPN